MLVSEEKIELKRARDKKLLCLKKSLAKIKGGPEMRSVGKLVLALALVLSVSSSANAAAFVWAQLGAGSSPGVAQVSGGESGASLVLTKPNTPGTYTINIDVMVRSSTAAATQGITGYRSVFLKSATDTGLSLGAFSNLNPMAWTGTVGAGSNANTGNTLIDALGNNRSGTQTTISSGNSPKNIYSLSLTIVKEPGVVFGAEHRVWGAVSGGGAWAQLPVADNFVTMGPNPSTSGAAGSAVDTQAERDSVVANLLPLIIIRNVPEPATIGLLALGMLGLIRRRS